MPESSACVLGTKDCNEEFIPVYVAQKKCWCHATTAATTPTTTTTTTTTIVTTPICQQTNTHTHIYIYIHTHINEKKCRLSRTSVATGDKWGILRWGGDVDDNTDDDRGAAADDTDVEGRIPVDDNDAMVAAET
jgi:hypothetical protein